VGYHNLALTSDETLILGRKGSIGSVYYSSVPCWPIDTTYFVERTTSLNLKFFLHLLSSLQLVRLDQSTAIPGLSRDDYDDIIVRIPPSLEQHRIVAAIEQQFTRLDSAVASLQSAKARAKQYRTSLLKAAVGGELTKEWRAVHPTEETGTQLLARILAERRARWEEEQLAKMREKGITSKDDKWKQAYKEPQGPNVEQLSALPEGWCWATVEQVGDATEQIVLTGPFGSTLGREDFRKEGIPLLTIGCLTEQGISLEKAFYISEKKASELERYRVRAGDILFSRMASVGRAGLVLKELEGSLINYHLMRLRLSNTAIDPLYFISFIRGAKTVTDYIREVNHGVTRDGINTNQLLNLPIAIPPLAQQAQIVAEVEARMSNITHMEVTIEASLKRAEHERQSILREAFAGRLVPQNPEDEPASVLLERIHEERKKREEAEKIARASRKGIQMEVAKKRRAGRAGLYTTLVEAKRPLPPDDLFKRAGLKTDEQPESVEVFYEELHADVELALIAETRPDDAYVLLEALEASAEVQAHMAEAKATTQAPEEEQNKKTIDAPMLWEL
jgi:type I restriction enzyme, S subunit